jgi:hypothetical protein
MLKLTKSGRGKQIGLVSDSDLMSESSERLRTFFEGPSKGKKGPSKGKMPLFGPDPTTKMYNMRKEFLSLETVSALGSLFDAIELHSKLKLLGFVADDDDKGSKGPWFDIQVNTSSASKMQGDVKKFTTKSTSSSSSSSKTKKGVGAKHSNFAIGLTRDKYPTFWKHGSSSSSSSSDTGKQHNPRAIMESRLRIYIEGLLAHLASTCTLTFKDLRKVYKALFDSKRSSIDDSTTS